MRDKSATDKNERGPGLSRRDLLRAGGVATVAAGSLMTGPAAAAGGEADASDWDGIRKMGATRESYWREDGKYFVQDNVDTSKIDQGIIRARVDSGFVGHSSFYSHPAVLSDLILILRDGRDPGREHGRPLLRQSDYFWVLEDDYPRFDAEE